jgi:SagB-type dehydrogenase family enzyme
VSAEPDLAELGRERRTVPSATLVYGHDGPPQNDAAEEFHEASKLSRGFGDRPIGAYLLESDAWLRVTSLRAAKRHPHRPVVHLPAPALPAASLAEAIEARRSAQVFADDPLAFDTLSTVLYAAYGVKEPYIEGDPPPRPPRRTVPSGGALYPLEIYVLAWNVRRLHRGLYHFDPIRHVLERLRAGDLEREVRAAMIYAEPALTCGALLVVSAMFWRSRFKYGLRGYRFVLLEAGHVVQNVQLAAAALGLGSLPMGGYFDRSLDEVLDVDGVNESALYCVAIGNVPDGV